jgi:Zn ribbon nucleic-acid-binding protein
MWILKNCPKCKGDLYTESDSGIYYDSCLQCGYTREHRAMPAINHSNHLRPIPLYVKSLDRVALPSRR